MTQYQIVINFDSAAGKFSFVGPVDNPIIMFGMLQQTLTSLTNAQKPADKRPVANGLVVPEHGALGRLASGN